MKIHNFRRTEALDLVYIQKLMESDSIYRKTKYNLISLLERSLFSLTAVGASGEIVGCLMLNDTPPISLVKGIYGSDWLKTAFEFKSLNTCNTLFILLIVVKEEYKKRGFVDIIRAAFRTVADLNHILFLVPETVDYDDFDDTLPKNFLRMRFSNFVSVDINPIYTRTPPVEEEGQCEQRWDVVHFMRRDFDPALRCRLASVKDSDDIAPIFNEKSNILLMLYGDFYLSELVESQNEDMKTVVLESQITRRAVGFMNATTLYDVEFLNREYNLQSFDFLQKHAQHKPTPSRVPSIPRLQIDLSIADVNSRDSKDTLVESVTTTERFQLDTSLIAFREDVDPNFGFIPSTLSTDDLRSTILSDEFSVDRETRLAYVSSGNWIRRHLKGYFGENYLCETQKTVFSRENNNAFVIQLYGLLSEFDARAKDFLPFMFDQFPDTEYAVISVPRLDPETTLLQEFCRVTPRANSAVTQDLYVYHRANLISDFKVRPATRNDLSDILDLGNQMHPFDRKLLAKDIKTYMNMGCEPDGTALFCYVALCLEKIVGVFFARAEEHIDWLKANYNLEDYVYFIQHGKHEFATIVHFILSSTVHSRARLFLREVMRQSGKTCFLYLVYPPFSMDTKVKLNTPLSCLGDFYAIRPRRKIVYPTQLVKSEKGPLDSIISCPLDDPPPAVYHISRNLIMEPKIVLNPRIIVVGASSTSLAFLERLTFVPHIRFNNLVLLSPHGMPGNTEASENRRVPLFYPPRYMQDRWRLGQLSLHTSVNVVLGNLTAIDRNRKLITIDGDREMSYDFLILAPGLQYHPPSPIGIDPKVIADNRRQNPCEQFVITSKHKASNLFLLNDEYSTTEAIEYIEKNLMPDTSNERRLGRRESLQTDMLLEDPSSERKPNYVSEEGPIIVYGDCLDAYACVYGLLHMGIPGIRIIMMHPSKKPDVKEDEHESRITAKPLCHTPSSAFDDHTVDSAINKEMDKAGVRIFKRCVLVRWNDDPTVLFVDKVECAVFIIDGLERRIRCVAFFSFVDRKIDYFFFKAVNDASLVFDNKLVIDINFLTSDPSIRAAGPATKYRRIYYNDKYTHSLFNSLEVGEKLGDAFLKEFDPNIEMARFPSKDKLNLMPSFKMPHVVYATLPGGYSYLKICAPGFKKNLLLRSQESNFV